MILYIYEYSKTFTGGKDINLAFDIQPVTLNRATNRYTLKKTAVDRGYGKPHNVARMARKT